jgi:hypothetical protein
MAHLLRRRSASVWFLAIVGCFAAAARGQVVTKQIDGFALQPWVADGGNNAIGTISVQTDVPPTNAPAGQVLSLLIQPEFAGSFAGFGVGPAHPLIIPGAAQSISAWIKVSDPGYEVKFSFHDGWGRERTDGQYMNWGMNLKGAIGAWKQVRFVIPAGWVQPIQINAITVDNWETKTDVKKVQVSIADVEIKTDISNVDAATGILKTWTPEPHPANAAAALKAAPATSLIAMEVSSPVAGNVFTGALPDAVISIRNWKPQALSGDLKYQIVDDAGRQIASQDRPLQAESMAGLSIPLQGDRYGLYILKADLALSSGGHQTGQLSYAHIPPPAELTEAQKLASPYGVNYYGGRGPILKAFRNAGIVWFREYSFTYAALMHAKGDGSFSGWPYFPQMVAGYQAIGAEMMPVIQGSITPPQVQDGVAVGDVGPSQAWVRNMTAVLLAFPDIKYWEVSNEYDLPDKNSAAEQAVHWLNYEKFHAKLAEIADLIGGGKLTVVENGHPGIFPEIESQVVKSGYFDNIPVINSHHYTGTEPPETNFQNYNTHSDYLLHRDPALLYDQLRQSTRAGQIDGKPRQHWLTEFGWDTLAGPVVSPFQQAVFLQRGWMLAMAAGCSKAFWFYNFDSKDPKVFFDGCGLFTYDMQPKLSLPAMAGISSILPTPKYVGMINAGDNTAGYVFEQDGKLVATLFAIQGEGPMVHLNCEKLCDYFGNPIADHNVKLTMAPVYAIGIERADPLYQQTAYSMYTDYMTGGAAGDLIKPVVQIQNNRASAIDCTITADLPANWTMSTQATHVTVAPGEQKLVELPMQIDPNAQTGTKIVALNFSEAGPIKTIPVRVFVHPSVVLRVAPIAGQSGHVTLAIDVTNHSTVGRSGEVRLHLPSTWSADAPSIAVADLAAGETRQISVGLNWDDQFPANESATAEFVDGHGMSIIQPIIPPALDIHEMEGISLDGDMSHWPADTQIPPWMLGSSAGVANAAIHLGWSTQGLYCAVEVHDSKVAHNDPTTFWTQDALEMFVDSGGNQSQGFGPQDHQFWIVPMVEQHRAYLGRWKVVDEIAKTQFDIPGVQSWSGRTSDGYAMEFLIPAADIQNYQPTIGKRIGINLNLSIHGQELDREVFWPRSKSAGVQKEPENWGSMQLVR